jgi:esterase/lipase superfamily enzyme
MQEMHLMAHSMGCELVTAALEHLERLNQDGCFSFFFPTFNWPNHL